MSLITILIIFVLIVSAINFCSCLHAGIKTTGIILITTGGLIVITLLVSTIFSLEKDKRNLNNEAYSNEINIVDDNYID